MKPNDWSRRINEMAWGFKDSAVLLNSLRAGIFEALGEEWKSAGTVARDLELDERAVNTVLHALVAMEICRKDADLFSTEPEARPLLLADSPQTLKSILGHGLFMMRGWAHLDEVLRTGEPARKEERSPQQMRDFICGMENVSRQSSRDVAAKVDFSTAERLLDLGGGPGTAAITFAEANPRLECVVFDLEGPIGIAEEQIQAAGLMDRVSTRVGDFHEDEYGEGFDVVYISNIIHMIDAESTLAVLEKSHRALRSEGRLMLKDFYLEDCKTRPVAAASFSVNMLVNTRGGKTYTRTEILDLLNRAGFEVSEEVQVAAQSTVIVATPR